MFLKLDQAADRVKRITNDPEFTADRILQDGAEGQIPIYWRNSAQIWTRLSDFKGDLKGTDSANRFMQLNPHDVAKFETALQADVLSFELTDQDCDKLTKLFGSVNDADGNTLGFRHAVGDEPVTIHRDQLYIDEHDLMRMYVSAPPASESTEPPPDAPAATTASDLAQGTAPPADTGVALEEWITKAQERARAIVEDSRKRDLYPNQIEISDTIAAEFRKAGIVGTDRKPLAGAYIKRHALKGITSATVKKLSTTIFQGK